MKLAAYVPLLMDRFPDGAFTTDSLEHVARQCMKGFPTYPELAEHLSAWWRERRPPLIAIQPPAPQPPRPPPTPEEIAYVQQLTQQVVASLRVSEMAKAAAAQAQLDALGISRRPRALHLPPAVLDQLNPLPNGRKRDASTTTPADAVSPASDAATVDPAAA